VTTFLLGARTSAELPFRDELAGCTDLHVATDDGSEGFSGFVVGLLDEFSLVHYDSILVCGPEKMMHAVLGRLMEHAAVARSHFSLHRYMKCGVGVCGSCCIDPSGLRVCRDGPVFSGELLLESEFGRYARDAAGVKRKA
jgi:dihydroorotate dehydrogenase electron transfer subunit